MEKEYIEKWRVDAMLSYLENHLKNGDSKENLLKVIKNYKTFTQEVEVKNKDKHLNGYLYDSLCYRYIRAREQMAEYNYLKDPNAFREKEYYYRQANRDIMRFCQILDEAIGEHD